MQFPFCVLENVLNCYSPQRMNIEKSKLIREQVFSLGIIDHVLIALSYLTSQKHKFVSLRVESEKYDSIVSFYLKLFL